MTDPAKDPLKSTRNIKLLRYAMAAIVAIFLIQFLLDTYQAEHVKTVPTVKHQEQ